jgi:hypothetical protein
LCAELCELLQEPPAGCRCFGGLRTGWCGGGRGAAAVTAAGLVGRHAWGWGIWRVGVDVAIGDVRVGESGAGLVDSVAVESKWCCSELAGQKAEAEGSGRCRK